MKVLFIFTGGTIGSVANDGFIGVDGNRPRVLLAEYERVYGASFAYDCVEPYTGLSENNTGDTLRALCACVAAHKDGGYNGIVVTHGTDTLQYTAAALSYAFADISIPLCLVSANYPVGDVRSNALANLRGALRFITEVGRAGVWVPYQNAGEPTHIHRGTRLLESIAFTDRAESVFSTRYGTFLGNKPFLPSPDYRECADALPALGVPAFAEDVPQILRIQPYPGMVYPEIGKDVRYILHASFHSGTVNTASSEAKRFFAEAQARRIPVFLTGVTRGDAYESTRAFAELGITPLYHIAPVAAFVKLWMLSAHYATVTAEMLQSSLAGDIIPSLDQ